MTLDEAIIHAEEVAEQNEWFDKNYLKSIQCRECAEEHRQLAEWLKDYKRLKEQEPCDDAISRQAMLKIQAKYAEYMGATKFWQMRDDIRALPPVTSQQSGEDIAKAFQFGLTLGFGEKHDEMDKVIDEIKKTITLQQKIGHWITKDGKEQGYDMGGVKTWYIQIMCSECGFIKTAIEGHTGQYHYCPNCGCRMVES